MSISMPEPRNGFSENRTVPAVLPGVGATTDTNGFGSLPPLAIEKLLNDSVKPPTVAVHEYADVVGAAPPLKIMSPGVHGAAIRALANTSNAITVKKLLINFLLTFPFCFLNIFVEI